MKCKYCKTKLEVVIKSDHMLEEECVGCEGIDPLGNRGVSKNYTIYVCPNCLDFFEQYLLKGWDDSDEEFYIREICEPEKKLSFFVEKYPEYINFKKMKKVLHKANNKFSDYMKAIAYEIVYQDKPNIDNIHHIDYDDEIPF